MKEACKAIEKYQPLWGSWKVEELIGQGNGSELYRVYKEEWGRRYFSTVKLLSFFIGKSDIIEAQAIGIEAASMPEYFKSLVGNILNEIELMYKLRGNSNIVTYEDHAIYEKKGELGWDLLIRMEFLQPLPDFLMKQELKKSDVVKLGIDICKALEACGKEGIIHRDIKDSSIFVSPKGEFKLGSFSMAKELLKGGRNSQTMFSPLYMAPELYKEQNYDFSIDTYSLGIVMYKLLNRGRLPFLPLPPENITVYDTERSIADRMSGKELILPVDAGDSLGAIVLKACSYDKRDRYKSPHEFRQKLERYFKTEAKFIKGDTVVVSENTIYAAAGCEEAEAQSKCAEEAEREAVAELASSVDKTDNESKLRKKKWMICVAMGVALMIVSFGFAFISAYEVEPVAEEPAPKPVVKTVQLKPSPIIAAPIPSQSIDVKDGEEYYQEGLEYMKNKKFGLAISTFEEAKKLGYDSKKVDGQIRVIRKSMEVQKLAKKASAYYEQQDYKKAIATFAELSEIDASYYGSAKYEDSHFKLVEKYNLSGVKYFNEGKLEQSVKEFEAAIEMLESLKKRHVKYDTQNYSKWIDICKGNKSRMLEKIQKIKESFKLAAECNIEGVKFFNQGSFHSAKYKFESAVNHLTDIRVLVPGYSVSDYEGLMQVYLQNLKNTELKLK